ncbi:hypothetical protein PAPYR_9338 [Paratrimastix pyriformis]|uniref:Uncharacterized protein n=1 Tax=Paratrimastix pyriformis TaxID=342808 RepID=A0ABQ8U8K9_9EUKA|nr:hypothetical protein PAPYR_9338 [Paratrimastix pyriformis]
MEAARTEESKKKTKAKFKAERENLQRGLYDARGNRRLCARQIQLLFGQGEKAERAFQRSCHPVIPPFVHLPMCRNRTHRFVAGSTGKPGNRGFNVRRPATITSYLLPGIDRVKARGADFTSLEEQFNEYICRNGRTAISASTIARWFRKDFPNTAVSPPMTDACNTCTKLNAQIETTKKEIKNFTDRGEAAPEELLTRQAENETKLAGHKELVKTTHTTILELKRQAYKDALMVEGIKDQLVKARAEEDGALEAELEEKLGTAQSERRTVVHIDFMQDHFLPQTCYSGVLFAFKSNLSALFLQRMSSIPETSGSLQWLSNAIKKHESGLARRVRHHYERDVRQLSVDICSLVDFIAQHAPKDFSEHLSSYLFPTLTPFTIRVLDRYPELKSDPHYRSMRNSKSESRFPPPKPKKASVQPLTSKKVPDPPASDHAFAPPTPTPMVVQHSGHCESTPPPPPLKRSAPRERHRPQPPAPLVPPPPFPYGPVIPLEAVPIRQLVPVVPLGATPETLDSGDPGPPQPRARRRRRR